MELLLDLEELLEATMGTCQAPKSIESKEWKNGKAKIKGQSLKDCYM